MTILHVKSLLSVQLTCITCVCLFKEHGCADSVCELASKRVLIQLQQGLAGLHPLQHINNMG